jgi:hypothetical protein
MVAIGGVASVSGIGIGIVPPVRESGVTLA